MKNHIAKFSVIFIFALFLSWLYLSPPQSILSFDNYLRDTFFKMRGDIPQHDQVTIIDIDEKALKEYGQWPWSRNLISLLVQKLTDAQAGIIGLDMVFSEPDRTSPDILAAQSGIYSEQIENYDVMLGKTFSHTPTIGGYFFLFEDQSSSDSIPLIPATFIEKNLAKNDSMLKPKGVVLNIDPIQQNLYSSGFFNSTPDTDGMIRRVPLLMRYKGMIYPSLTLEMLRIYSNSNKVEILGNDLGLEKIIIGNLEIPVDHAGRMFVNFRAGGHHFKYISAADILNDNFDKSDIDGKFIIFGTSSVGLSDLRAIPLDNAIPGVEIHANVIDNILSGDFLVESFDQITYDLIIIWIIVFLFSLLLSFFNSWLLFPLVLILILSIFEFFFYLLFSQGIVINLLFPLLAFSGTLILTILVDYIQTSRQKEYIQQTFAKKVSKAVMDDLIKEKRQDILEAHEQEASVFFSDIRGFTTIAENLNSSQKLVTLLNQYLTPMVEEISKTGGTVDKFIGDAIMAYWNAPKKTADHADKALQTALNQLKVLNELNQKLSDRFDVRLKIGIGIHTGVVTVGEMGSLNRSDYTIIGDNVNLASRLESLNKIYGSTIIISKDTKEQLTRDYRLRSLDIVQVKGKNRPIEVFEVISDTVNTLADEIESYHDALALFRDHKLNEAYQKFSELTQKYDSPLYRLYLARCIEYIENPDKAFTVIYRI